MIPRKRQDVRLDDATVARVAALVPRMPQGATKSDAYRYVIEAGLAAAEADLPRVPRAKTMRTRAGR